MISVISPFNSRAEAFISLFVFTMETFQPSDEIILPRNAARRDAYVSVRLPNMFVLFLSEKPVINRCYETVKEESEFWIARSVRPTEVITCSSKQAHSRICAFGNRTRRVITKCDFSYFCSIVVPDASPLELRTVCDWGNWVCVSIITRCP